MLCNYRIFVNVLLHTLYLYTYTITTYIHLHIMITITINIINYEFISPIALS